MNIKNSAEGLTWQFGSVNRNKAVKLAGTTNFDSFKMYEQVFEISQDKQGKMLQAEEDMGTLMAKVRIILL